MKYKSRAEGVESKSARRKEKIKYFTIAPKEVHESVKVLRSSTR
jgi:hypothetical protein